MSRVGHGVGALTTAEEHAVRTAAHSPEARHAQVAHFAAAAAVGGVGRGVRAGGSALLKARRTGRVARAAGANRRGCAGIAALAAVVALGLQVDAHAVAGRQPWLASELAAAAGDGQVVPLAWMRRAAAVSTTCAREQQQRREHAEQRSPRSRPRSMVPGFLHCGQPDKNPEASTSWLPSKVNEVCDGGSCVRSERSRKRSWTHLCGIFPAWRCSSGLGAGCEIEIEHGASDPRNPQPGAGKEGGGP